VYDGALSLTVSPWLHRELSFLARTAGLEISQIAAELLAAGLTARHQPRARGPQHEPAERQGQGEGGERRERRDRPQRKNYFDIMNDKAHFLEYVRGLENRGGGGGGGGGRRGGGRGRGGPRE
jgi:hypothetical protein